MKKRMKKVVDIRGRLRVVSPSRREGNFEGGAGNKLEKSG
jgi:hypothetical protein